MVLWDPHADNTSRDWDPTARMYTGPYPADISVDALIQAMKKKQAEMTQAIREKHAEIKRLEMEIQKIREALGPEPSDAPIKWSS